MLAGIQFRIFSSEVCCLQIGHESVQNYSLNVVLCGCEIPSLKEYLIQDVSEQDSRENI
jgi:hypothetical protein